MLLINTDNARHAPEFNRSAQLLVWAWRLIVTGRASCPLIRWEFDHACTHDAEPVCSALCGFLCALARTRRRRLIVNHPGHPALTPDEVRMLTLIAATQAGNDALAAAHLRWIAKRDVQELLVESVHELATSLGANGLWLASSLGNAAVPTCADHAVPGLSCVRRSTG